MKNKNNTLAMTIDTADGLYHLDVDSDGEITITQARGGKSVTLTPKEILERETRRKIVVEAVDQAIGVLSRRCH